MHSRTPAANQRAARPEGAARVGSALALPLASLSAWTVTPQTLNEGRLRALGVMADADDDDDDALDTVRDDARNAHAAREFARKGKEQNAAFAIQRWWRVASSAERRRFQAFIVMLKYQKTVARKPFFRVWRQEARALAHSRRAA